MNSTVAFLSTIQFSSGTHFFKTIVIYAISCMSLRSLHNYDERKKHTFCNVLHATFLYLAIIY
jgi:hypothetical protein